MKVLWFTNTPSLSADHLKNKSIGGGWIGSLEAEFARIPFIELGISFNYEHGIKPFTLNKTKYFPIHTTSPTGKVKNLVSRWRKPVENEGDIQAYLNVIDEFKPDIIHIFGTEGVFGLVISKTNVPSVIHIQGNLTVYDYKWYSGITAVDVLRYSRKWNLLKGFGIYHQYRLNKKQAMRERRIFQQCKYFMGRTDWDRRITSVLSPHAKYFHCDEMIRPLFYSHKWLPKDSETSYILISTIRNNLYKGLETVFECKKLLNKILGNNFTWKIAGINGQDEISNLLERKYGSTFQENGIDLLGALQEKELIDELLAADVFVHPSHVDNSPNSICEAMLLGMPIIATYAGGIPSIIENHEEGLLIQDGDFHAMAGAVLEFHGNRSYATELGKKARATAIKRHDPQKIIDTILKVYSAVNVQ